MTQRRPIPRIDFSWHGQAACRGEDLNLFYGPEKERQPERDIRQAKAKKICADCPVKATCLQDAFVRNDQHGVRGGLDEDERKAARARWMRQPARVRAAA